MTNKFFADSKYSKNNKSKVVVFIIVDNKFWNDCLIVVKFMVPFVHLLFIIDYVEDLQWDISIKAYIGLVKASRNCLITIKDYTSLIHKS